MNQMPKTNYSKNLVTVLHNRDIVEYAELENTKEKERKEGRKEGRNPVSTLSFSTLSFEYIWPDLDFSWEF